MQDALQAYSETAKTTLSPRDLEANLLLKAASHLQIDQRQLGERGQRPSGGSLLQPSALDHIPGFHFRRGQSPADRYQKQCCLPWRICFEPHDRHPGGSETGKTRFSD